MMDLYKTIQDLRESNKKRAMKIKRLKKIIASSGIEHPIVSQLPVQVAPVDTTETTVLSKHDLQVLHEEAKEKWKDLLTAYHLILRHKNKRLGGKDTSLRQYATPEVADCYLKSDEAVEQYPYDKDKAKMLLFRAISEAIQIGEK